MARGKKGTGATKQTGLDDVAKGIIASALERFDNDFGDDEFGKAAFSTHVVPVLQEKYAKHPQLLELRLNKILETGYDARDPCHYFAVACLAEGENRPLNYDEVARILNNGHCRQQSTLYHFDTVGYQNGFLGRPGMLLSTTKNQAFLRSSEEFGELTRAERLYVNPVTVLVPGGLLNLTARKIGESPRDALIEKALLGRTSPYQDMWYQLEREGTVMFGKREVFELD